jgi:DNA-binding GntR family transcriptional regulator
VRRIGKKANNKVVLIEKKTANERVAKLLDIKVGEDVFYMERLRCIGENPFLLEQSYMPYSMFSDLDEEVLEGSKYEYVEKKGYTIKESNREIIAEIPSEYVSELLNLSKNEPVLKAKSVSSLADGRVFEYTEVSYSQRKYKFILKAEYKKEEA